MNQIEKLKWRIAELVDKLPGQCWSSLADWPLGTRRVPWAPIDQVCRKDFAQNGACYCGKLRTPESCLPRYVGSGVCPTCSALPGKVHELSCEQVSPAEFRNYIAAQERAR